MARAPQVTRTIKTTNCTLMCVHTETAEVFNKDVVLPRTFEDDNAILKAAKKVHETDTIKVVAVVQSSVTETLYGMSESDFIAHAKPLPPRTGTSEGDTQHQSDDPASSAPVVEDAPTKG